MTFSLTAIAYTFSFLKGLIHLILFEIFLLIEIPRGATYRKMLTVYFAISSRANLRPSDFPSQ
jgi:hypothetical protein